MVSFEVLPTGYQWSWGSILQMRVAGSVGGQYGNCIPCILFHGQSLTANSLRIGTDLNGKFYPYDSTKKFPLNNWIKVKIEQTEAWPSWTEVNTTFSIYLDDEKVYEIVNKQPSYFDNVTVYVSDPWNPKQAGKIRNLTIDNRKPSGKEIILLR